MKLLISGFGQGQARVTLGSDPAHGRSLPVSVALPLNENQSMNYISQKHIYT